MSRRSVHTIYVPPGYSPEQVWEHISRKQPVPKITGGEWANVLVEGGYPDDGYWVHGRLEKLLA